MAEIALVNPRFEVSYWGLEHALGLLGKRANTPAACLPLLAALTPAEHRVTVWDENVRPLDFDRLARADMVGLTGMVVQRHRMREILTELKARGVFTVVGGPWVTVEEEYFGPLADVIFVGEAEETWPRFLQDWQAGGHQRRYEQSARSDLTAVPCPRYELLPAKHYLCGSVQFSRGCPFQCEFCDIIVTFGRRPRLKTSAQILQELETLRRCGFRMVFIVDDNLIGNKKAIQEILADVAAWQRERGYPLTFFTEASLDLAEEDELLRLMVAANIQCVFIGIESPNEESLRETKKLQNLRASGGTLLERVRKIQRFGLEVWSGMIVGFDHDTPDIFDAQIAFLREARIAHAMVGMLAAIPKTPLHARLAAEGRLDRDDSPAFGVNVLPLHMSREELSEGYLRVMQELYQAQAWFDRIDHLFLDPEFTPGAAEKEYLRTRPWSRLKTNLWHRVRANAIYWRLMQTVDDPALREEYRRRMTNIFRSRRDPYYWFVYALKCAMHFHYQTMIQRMAQKETPLVNTF